MSDKKVLIIGSGGREHALAWKLAQSEQVERIFVAPGNGGTAKGISKCENVEIAVTDTETLLSFATENAVDLVVIGPDDVLADGFTDVCQTAGLTVFGPTQKAAQIESSKAFAKDLMQDMSIPTAAFKHFTDFDAASTYITDHPLPIVIKASGLALGKGVIICETHEEAQKTLTEIMQEKIFGEAGSEVVIEQFLTGHEVSIHALSDGENYTLFPTAQDHKQVGESDNGPNTGGMGAISPVPWVMKSNMLRIEKNVVAPALEGLKNKDALFAGCLYPGLMMTEDGAQVIEYNARFGDPETQVYMKLLDSDFYELLHACATKSLADVSVSWRDGTAACVVIASGGYPESYEKGKVITGIADAESDPDVTVFHAGTTIDGDNLITSGGRVLGVTAYGDDLESALAKAYVAVEKIQFEDMYYRKDIGKKSLNLL